MGKPVQAALDGTEVVTVVTEAVQVASTLRDKPCVYGATAVPHQSWGSKKG
jgi:hypothetical protein